MTKHRSGNWSGQIVLQCVAIAAIRRSTGASREHC
jgi:hypothetical protein